MRWLRPPFAEVIDNALAVFDGMQRARPEGLWIKRPVNTNSIKMYGKQRSVLRIETTLDNPCSCCGPYPDRHSIR